MSVVITGGAGFLGLRLARAIAAAGRLVLPDGTAILRPRLVLADRMAADPPDDLAEQAESVALDVTDPVAIKDALQGAQAVFHLAAVVSGQAEAEFDLGLAANFDGTRNVLEAARAAERRLPVVGTSSIAVFGAGVKEPVTETTPTQPTNSYGAAKAMAEILMSDYRRRGLVEARCLRLPTIVVRPGKPNAAASSFASSIFREPLAGAPAICPVDPGIAMWVASPDTAVAAMVHAMAVPEADWPGFAVLNVPGVRATVSEMLEALDSVGGPEARARVTLDPDPAIEAIVAGWAGAFDTHLAEELGFAARERSMEDLVRAYLRDQGA